MPVLNPATGLADMVLLGLRARVNANACTANSTITLIDANSLKVFATATVAPGVTGGVFLDILDPALEAASICWRIVAGAGGTLTMESFNILVSP